MWVLNLDALINKMYCYIYTSIIIYHNELNIPSVIEAQIIKQILIFFSNILNINAY